MPNSKIITETIAQQGRILGSFAKLARSDKNRQRMTIALLKSERIGRLIGARISEVSGYPHWGALGFNESGRAVIDYLARADTLRQVVLSLHRFEEKHPRLMPLYVAAATTPSRLIEFRAFLAGVLKETIYNIRKGQTQQTELQLMERTEQIALKMQELADERRRILAADSLTAAIAREKKFPIDAMTATPDEPFRALDENYRQVAIYGEKYDLTRYAGAALRFIHGNRIGRTAEEVRRAAGCAKGTKTSIFNLFRNQSGRFVWRECVESKNGLYYFKEPKHKS